MANRKKSGGNQLANVLTTRMKNENKSAQVIDFGEITTNLSLVTNTFPVPIPKEDYTLLQPLLKKGETAEEVIVEEGDRVVVVWIGAEAVVIGRI